MRALLCLLALAGPLLAGQDGPPPRVLVLGDFVYNEASRSAAELLRLRAEVVHRPFAPGEGATTGNALDRLDALLGDEPWDLIHFNFGLADLAHRVPGIEAYRVMPAEAGGVRATPLEEYRANLEQLVTRLQATEARLVWASTTPIRGTLSGVFQVDSELPYNAAAAEVMAAADVPINDMHAHVLANVDEKALRSGPFWFDRKPLGMPIARAILTELELLRPVTGPVKVFVLVGGWTHIGGGAVRDLRGPQAGSPVGSLDHLALEEGYDFLVTPDGRWATRSDVWVQFDRRGPRAGDLGVGYGGDRKHEVGVELGMGYALGDAFEEQVLLLKTALGTPSVGEDLCPPSSGTTGRAFTQLVQQVEDTLNRPGERFLDSTDQATYELAGMILCLGEDDEDPARCAELLPMLIQDLRATFDRPDLPAVLVGSPRAPELLEAQRDFDLPAVTFADARPFWPAEDERSAVRHPAAERWFGNAESFYRLGAFLGAQLLD